MGRGLRGQRGETPQKREPGAGHRAGRTPDARAPPSRHYQRWFMWISKANWTSRWKILWSELARGLNKRTCLSQTFTSKTPPWSKSTMWNAKLNGILWNHKLWKTITTWRNGSDKSKIQNVVRLFNDVDYPNENETSLGPLKRFKTLTMAIFSIILGRAGGKGMRFFTRKHWAHQVYETLSLL